MRKWKLALSSADEAPSTAPILLQGDICENLKKAKELGYDAIEVHTREIADLDFEAISKTTQQCGVSIAMIVTGRLNTEGCGSLIDDRPYVVDATILGMKKYIDMAAKVNADIVIGWVKGKVPPGGNYKKYIDRLAGNLKILEKYGVEKNVKLHLEVINHYEVNIFTTAQETVDFIERYDLKNCYVHLDTFHMGIEETHPIKAIQLCKGKLGYMHLADNTRRYPGSGQFEFHKILKALDEIGYDGYLSIECFPYPDGETAAIRSIHYLKELFSED